jgi:dihydroorotate dehydrogenase electron transfer subunit
MRLKAPVVADRAQPGQFVHVRCGRDEVRFPASGTFPLLRRPFSLLDLNTQTGAIDFIYKVVGLGTSALAQVPVRSRVDLLGPLGHPFQVPATLETAVLVGGGVGIPPLYLLAKRIVDRHSWIVNRKIVAFLGARTKDWVICAKEFRRLRIPVHVATDDGTLGYRGSVVDLLRKFLRTTNHESRATALYVCGPTPMMSAVAGLARKHRIPCQVSLEERMGCAMGCCLGCVVEMATESPTSHSRFQRVCTEGPVFPAEAIVWEMA